MKASDITDTQMLEAVRRDINVRWGTGPYQDDSIGACIWTIAERERWPLKVANAKLGVMMRRRDLVDGCTCGCRGGWTITEPDKGAIA